MNEFESIIADLERKRAAIDKAIDALKGVSGVIQPAAKHAEAPTKEKESVNSEGRQRQIEGIRRYWAAKRTGGKKAAPKNVAKKGGLSAAGRRSLSEKMKERWAEKRAADKK